MAKDAKKEALVKVKKGEMGRKLATGAKNLESFRAKKSYKREY